MSSYTIASREDDPVHTVRTIARIAQMLIELRDEYVERPRPDILQQIDQRLDDLLAQRSELKHRMAQARSEEEPRSALRRPDSPVRRDCWPKQWKVRQRAGRCARGSNPRFRLSRSPAHRRSCKFNSEGWQYPAWSVGHLPRTGGTHPDPRLQHRDSQAQ